MQTILIISFSPLERDGRVQRQIVALQRNYQVVTAGYGPLSLPGVRHYSLPVPSMTSRMFSLFVRATGLYDRAIMLDPDYRQALKLLKDESYDAVLANDVSALPVGVQLAQRRGIPLLLDLHEWSPGQFTDLLLWRIMIKRFILSTLDRYLSYPKAIWTVGEGIARLYYKHYGIKPEVIRNVPFCFSAMPRFRQPDGVIRLVHHGGATPSRRLERMIKAVALAGPHFHLDLMLVANSHKHRRYLKFLEKAAGDMKNIHFRQPVSPSRIVSTLNQSYDVGIYLLPLANENHTWAMPNKLFEFVQARLAVVVSPNPDMAQLVKQYGLGLVAADFTVESFAAALRSLTPETVQRFKVASHVAAKTLCWDKEQEKLLRIVRDVVSS